VPLLLTPPAFQVIPETVHARITLATDTHASSSSAERQVTQQEAAAGFRALSSFHHDKVRPYRSHAEPLRGLLINMSFLCSVKNSTHTTTPFSHSQNSDKVLRFVVIGYGGAWVKFARTEERDGEVSSMWSRMARCVGAPGTFAVLRHQVSPLVAPIS
jgi:hypothetical protein